MGILVQIPYGKSALPKRFFDFYENLQKCSLGKINLPYFGKSGKNFFLLEKNPTSSFKKVGILVQIPDG